MKTIKSYLFTHFNMLFILLATTTIAFFLLAIRLKITQSFFLLFLVWNLFLAAIPFILSSYLVSAKIKSKIVLLSATLLWLLFLPNAPYIVTDVIHLTHTSSTAPILDGFIIGSFAIGGLLYYLYSLQQMFQVWSPYVTSVGKKMIQIAIPFLCGYGIYLGRFERWNSWDIVQHPQQLFIQSLDPILHPLAHQTAWMVTASFGVVLFVIFKIFQKYQQIPASSTS